MKPFATLLTVLLLLSSAAYGQNHTYYYSDERKIPIEKAEQWAVVQIPESAQSALERAVARQPEVRLRKALNAERGFYWLEAKGQQALDSATLDKLSSQVQIQRTFPAFLYGESSDGNPMRLLTFDQFGVKFAPEVSRAEIDAFNEQHGVEVAPLDNEIDRRQAREYNEYTLRVTEASDLNALEAANRYYESALTIWSVPDFYVNLRPTGTHRSQSSANDPLYNEQYYLNNTSTNLGTADVDIDAPEAWALSKGSSSIIVAVVDQGVEQHEDFSSGQLVPGYSVGGGGGSPTGPHGQAVAGIIAANHNSKGVRGVAPNVKIMPINIFNGSYGTKTADAIDYAWQNGADVLNNSWSGPISSSVSAAFGHANNDGRNGKGSVIVASAGNNADADSGIDGFVRFPALLADALAVGAVSKLDSPANYTPRGDVDLDIVAPSSPRKGQGDVRTTDRMGSAGYESGDYTPRFGGTSAAAPQASGVAALMLSVNGSLTESEVRSKIEANADDYGSTDWDGDGRINAFQAVADAVPPLSVYISGPFQLDSGEQGAWYAQVSGGSGSPSYSWEANPTYASVWTSLSCSGSSCSHRFYNTCDVTRSAGIRVTVTVGTQTKTASKSVSIAPSGNGPNAPPCSAPTGVAGAAEGGRLSARGLPVQAQARGGAVRLSAGASVPEAFALEESYPNPVQAGQPVTIPFALPEAAEVTLEVYDVLGRPVRRIESGTVGAGHPRIAVGTEDLSGGVYVYRLTAGGTSGEPFSGTGKLVVVK